MRYIRFKKTGGIKKEIDTMLPDESISDLVAKLADAHEKFFDFVNPILIAQLLDSREPLHPIVGLENEETCEDTYNYFLKYSQSDEFANIKSKWMHDLLLPLLKQRQKIQNAYRPYLAAREEWVHHIAARYKKY